MHELHNHNNVCMQRPVSYEVPELQGAVESDVFERAGVYVPTAVSAPHYIAIAGELAACCTLLIYLYITPCMG